MPARKEPTGTWECDTCMVFNKAESSKCVACESPRPGAKPPTGINYYYLIIKTFIYHDL